MRKPITIAMAVSLAIHCGLFLALALLWDIRAEPAPSDTLLVLNLEPSVTDYGLDTRAERDNQTSRDESISAAQSGLASNPREEIVDPEARQASSPMPPPSETLRAALPAKPAQALTELTEKIDIMPTAGANLLATAAPSEQKIAAGYSEHGRRSREFVSIPSEQEQMLRRKFSEWSEAQSQEWDTVSTVSWRHEGREYAATFRPLPAEDEMGLDEVLVEITTEQDGRRLRSEMRMKRLAFSNFAQFVHWWDPAVQVHNDALDGRFHSNSRITVAFNRRIKPLFLGKVTTSSHGIRVGDESSGRLRREDIFLGGLETGVREILLPNQFLLFPGTEKPGEGAVHRFGEDTRIVFHADGSFSWQALGSELPAERVLLPDEPVYLVAAENVRLYLRGVVRGKVLVYSPERISIEGDLIYAHDPHKGRDPGDYLGLVCDKVVEVAGRSVTGPGDLRIHASIYAKRRFAVRGYRTRGNDLLYIYGSLTAGSITATEPRFSTRIEFDRRLETLRPPGFPVTDRFEVASWDGQWVVDDQI